MPRSKKSEIPEIVETDTSAVNLTEARNTGKPGRWAAASC